LPDLLQASSGPHGYREKFARQTQAQQGGNLHFAKIKSPDSFKQSIFLYFYIFIFLMYLNSLIALICTNQTT